MLQNPCKTLGFKKIMVYKIPLGGGGKPYPASGLYALIAESLLHIMFLVARMYIRLSVTKSNIFC